MVYHSSMMSIHHCKADFVLKCDSKTILFKCVIESFIIKQIDCKLFNNEK